MTLRSGNKFGAGGKRLGSMWTEDLRLQLIEVVIDVERQRLISDQSRLGKWNIIKKQLKGFSVPLRNRSENHFRGLYCAYKKLKKQGSLSRISFPSGKEMKISKELFVKFTEYDTMLKAYDGNVVLLTNHIEKSSKKVSCSEDDANVDDNQFSVSPPLTDYKNGISPGVHQGVSNSKDALAHDALGTDRHSQETKGVWPDAVLASVLETSGRPVADSFPCRRSGTKRPRESQNLTLDRAILESLLDTWLEEKGNTKAYMEIVLKGLLEEKLIVEKVREIFRDPNMRGRVSEFTTVDKQIQEFALKQMQLTVQAMHETIKKQMTEMVEQTNQDVLSMVRNFSSSFISTSQ